MSSEYCDHMMVNKKDGASHAILLNTKKSNMKEQMHFIFKAARTFKTEMHII